MYPGLPKPGISRVGWRQPAAPSGQVAPSLPGVAAASEDTNVEVDQLAVSLASQHDISIEAATKMADVLRANKKPIPAVPRKYTAVLQEYVNNHQAANKVLLEARSALEYANLNILAAMETLEVAKNEAIQLSQDLRSAKTEAQRTWDELEEHSANSKVASKTVQPKTSESTELSILQQVADLLSGLQRPDLGPLRVQLNACMAAAIPAGEQSTGSGGDPSVPPSGKLDIAMDEGPTNSKSPPIVANSDSVVVVPATAPSGSGGDLPVVLVTPANQPTKREMPDAASSGDEARYATVRSGQNSLQAGRLCHAKLLEAEKDAILGIPRLAEAAEAAANEEGGSEQYGS